MAGPFDFGAALLGAGSAGVAQTVMARSQAALGKLWPLPRLAHTRADHAGPIAPALDAARLGGLGTLEVRLATNAEEIRRAQRLRYQVFFEQGDANATLTARLTRLDTDRYDAACEHLLVIDHAAHDAFGPQVVGTYRLQRQEIARAHHGFYSAGEFAIEPLLSRHPQLQFLELGRSCVKPAYRNKRTVELLWHGIWSYVRCHKLDVMIGCASLEGIDPQALALPLSFLHHFASAPAAWQVQALPHRRVDMNRLPKSSIDPRAALRTLPPLLKGYLRLGAFVGDGAVVDPAFGTTDVLVVMPVAAISDRYIGHFGAEAKRRAA